MLATTASTGMHTGRSRIGAGVFIGIVHLGLLLALVRYAQTSFEPDLRTVPSTTVIWVPRQAAPPAAPPAAAAPASAPARAVPKAPAKAAPPPRPSAPAPLQLPADPVAAPSAVEQAPAPTPGKLDMHAMRAAARQIERERVPTALERVREAELHRDMDDNDTARAIKKTARPDCRTAYGGGTKANLLALIPLAIDTITDHGCKW